MQADQDAAFKRLIRRALIWGVVKKLLAGNDTCCFTTEQYKRGKEKDWVEKCKKPVPSWYWDYVPPEDDLRCVGMKEVRPGLWAEEAIR